jgi:cytochrome c oxidase accessory protein FixG
MKYFEKRKKTYPQNVQGFFRSLKNKFNVICLSIFFFFPLARFDRGELLPNQAFLIDIDSGRIYFFFITIWSQDLFYIAVILVFSAIMLFFVTSLFGRVWCGYTCPQTVWTDVFIKIERFFQGDRNSRIKLDRKNNFSKFYQKFATHFCWIILSFVTGLGFTHYFYDIFSSLQELSKFILPIENLLWAAGVAFMTYLMAGFAREQVCNYMCPYSKFQSAMFDNKTLIVDYDEKRGEPRGKMKKNNLAQKNGHCIDCNQCVVVCPQDIDIRDGLQMECISCGLCIDACNEVMNKFNLPPNLIHYTTVNHQKFKFFRPRVIFYLIISVLLTYVIVFGVLNKNKTSFVVEHLRNPLWVVMSSGDIRNSYKVIIENKANVRQKYILNIEGLENYKISNREGLDLQNIEINPGDHLEFVVHLVAKRKNKEIYFKINSRDREKIKKAVFIVE